MLGGDTKTVGVRATLTLPEYRNALGGEIKRQDEMGRMGDLGLPPEYQDVRPERDQDVGSKSDSTTAFPKICQALAADFAIGVGHTNGYFHAGSGRVWN